MRQESEQNDRTRRKQLYGRIRRKSLYLDSFHGEMSNGRAFGFIGTRDVNDYQGWFFVWPTSYPGIKTIAERNAVMESLELDIARPGLEQIPERWAQRLLGKYLEKHFDLGCKEESP